MADRIARDMMDMARSYESPAKKDPLMQDKETPNVARKPRMEEGETGSVRDFASKGREAANDSPEQSAMAQQENKDSDVDSSVRHTRQLSTSINSAFEREDDGDAARHDEMMRSQTEQSKHLSSLNDSMGNVYKMLFDKEHGPKMEQYKREQQGPAQAVSELASQLADQHSDLMKELQDIRYAIMNVDGGMLGDFGIGDLFGRRRRGRGRGRGPRGGGYDAPDRNNRSRTPGGGSGGGRGSWWSRIKGSVSSTFDSVKNVKGGSKAKIAALIGGGAAALWGANELADSATESGRNAVQRYPQESKENMRRQQAGLPPMEGQELVDFRRDITENYYGQTANPETGYALTPLQNRAVERGLYTPSEVVNVDRDDLARLAGGASSDAVPASAQPSSTMPNGGANTVGTPSAGMPSLGGTEMMLGGTAVGTGAYIMANRPTSQTVNQPRVSPSDVRVTDASEGRTTTVRNVATPANDPTPPKRKVVPESIRRVASNANARIPDSVKSAGSRTASAAGKGVSTVGKGMRRVPILGAGLTAYDAYNTITDDTLTTGEKAGALTDMGGGLAGAAVGAKGGALAGAAIGSIIPVAGTAIGGAVGGLIGGVGGYFAGEGITRSAREWIGGLWGDDEEEDNVRTSGQAIEGYDNYDVESVQTDKLAAKVGAEPSNLAPSAEGLIGDGEKASGKATKPDTSFLEGAAKTLTAIPLIGGAVSAAKSAKDFVTQQAEKDESGLMNDDWKTQAMSTIASPVIGAVKGATALYNSYIGSNDELKDPEVSKAKPTPANAQEIYDNAEVPATEKKKDAPANKVQSTTKTPTSADSKDSGGGMMETVYGGILSTLVGGDMSSRMMSGEGPATRPAMPSMRTPGQKSPPPLSPQVSRVGQKVTSRPTSAANVTTQTVSDTPPTRSQHGSVQKVIMVDPTVKKTREKKAEPGGGRTPSSTGTYENRSIRPSIDDTPALVTDFGLTLLNTGFI